MIVGMSASQVVRATVITPTLTFKGHVLHIDENARTATVKDRETETTVAELRDVTWSNLDRERWRVEGTSPDGQPTIWRAVRACGRCGSGVYQTADYERATLV
jgi:hypothetical protein